MPADNRAHLLAAARTRATETRQRARAALRQLDHDGKAVTFVAVADTAGVSRALLYRDQDLRAEIERLRAAQPRAARIPAAQRATDSSLQQRLEAALDDISVLRTENRRLRERLAVILGEQRSSTPRDGDPVSPTTTGR